MTKFNTAVFYDLENLLKGYSFSPQLIANLSLRDILEAVRQTGRIGQIALQRAYANWSDPRLAILRGEINELGIDPIQVFGFAREQKKNAADLQLAIDAIDLAHIRPALEIFVIVSGDGGFAALAKKLHEYGRMVIGCSYKSAVNAVFRSVCDDFVFIPDIEDTSAKSGAAFPGSPAAVQDPRNVRILQQIEQLQIVTPENIAKKALEIMLKYKQDGETHLELKRNGIYLSVVQEACRYAIPGFSPIQLGFPKFIECMQSICKDTEFCIVRPDNSQPMLRLRSDVPPGIEILPDLEKREMHCIEVYRALLRHGEPIFQLPAFHDLNIVINWLVSNPFKGLTLGRAIEKIVDGLQNAVSSEAVKRALISLVAAGTFACEPQGLPLSEQTLSLKPGLQDASEVVNLLKTAVYEKLARQLGSVAADVFHLLFSDPPPNTFE